MSFTLKSIELKNIKTHEYLLFEPALEGITAISGENGSGKSTIVDSLGWSLYGIRPSGIRNKNFIKDGVDPKDKPVSVKSTIIIGGIEYIVERKIISVSGTTECNVWGKKAGADKFTHVAGPAVSHVEKFIKNELGMNEKGFLTSVFIQQKQVDQIVSASPRERGIVIEELTGIASITQAIQKANENTRALEKAASIFTIGNIDEAKEKVEKQKNICNDIELKEQSAIIKFNEHRIIQTDLKNKLEIEREKVNKRILLTRNLENHKNQVLLFKKQAEDDLNFILDFRNKYGTTIFIDPKNSKKDVEEKRNKTNKIALQLNELNAELIQIIKNKENVLKLKNDFTTQKKAENELDKFQKQLNDFESELDKEKELRSMMLTELKHSQASHEHINGKETNCPVCKSIITDPENLKKEIEEDIENFKSKKKETEENIKSIEKKIKDVSIDIKSTEIAIEAIKEEKVLLKKEIELKKQLDKLINQSELMKSDLKVAEIEYDKVLRIEADKRALDDAKERSLTVNGKIDDCQKEINKLNENIKTLNALSDTSFASLEKQYREAEDRLMKMSVAGKELRGRKRLELERLDDNKKNLKVVEDAMEKYNEIANQIKVSTSAAAILSTFKTDRIEYSIPTLEFFASDFLSKFTGGTFTKMTIDEKFNTFVTTSNGIIRPVAQLSGGELSSAAIALRLGIAMLLDSSDKNVLILDEVLVSMDEDRSRQIMETIGSLSNSQIIFIAHNTDINAIADKTISVS